MTEDLKKFSDGTGSSNDPYQISEQADLMNIVSELLSGNDCKDKYYKVMNNIVLDSSWPGIGMPVMEYLFPDMPYAAGGIGFAGTLDGGGHTITVQRTEIDKQGVGGLINYLAPSGTLQNLNVAGSVTLLYSEKPTMEEAVEGLSVVGGVVGYNCGTIDKVNSSVTVTTEEEYDTTGVPAHVYNVGGIAGFNDNYYVKGAIGVIRNCSNSGDVTGYEKVGGIAGENAGLITSCSNSGQITPTGTTRSGSGGIAGRNGDNNTAIETGEIWNCYNIGNIYSGEEGKPETQSSWMGGIAGFQNTLSEIHNCYDTGSLRAFGWAGYIAGSCGYEKQASSEDESYGVYNSYVPTVDGVLVPKGGKEGPESADKEITIFGKEKSKEEMQTMAFAGTLQDKDADSYGAWVGKEGSYPTLANDATQSNEYAKGWKSEERKIYLDPAKGNDDNTGLSKDSPVKSLEKALSIATEKIVTPEGVEIIGISNIYIMSTVTIQEGKTLYDSVYFTRHTENGFEGPMFTIKVPNTEEDSITYVTFEGEQFDGGGKGTIFNVEQGRLRLRGSCVLKNAELGVLVNGSGTGQAQAELNEAWIGTAAAAKVAGATTGTGSKNGDTNNLILNPFGIYEVRMAGVVELAAGAYISVEAGLSCNVTLQCASWTEGKTVAVGYGGYALKAADAKHIYVTNAGGDSEYCAAFATDTATSDRLVLTPLIYLNGASGIEMGAGTVNDPYKNLSEALAAAKPGGWIMVGGTTDISEGSYTKNVVIRRKLQFDEDAPMFHIDANGKTVTLSNMTINGDGGAIATVGAGTLILSGGTGEDGNGVILTNSSVAVDVASGAAVTVLDAAIDASEFSIRLADSSSKFTLTPAAGTDISGTVYLPEDVQIEVGAALTNLSGALTVECQNPRVDLIIAQVTGDYKTFTVADTTYVTYLQGAYGIAVTPLKKQLQLSTVKTV